MGSLTFSKSIAGKFSLGSLLDSGLQISSVSAVKNTLLGQFFLYLEVDSQSNSPLLVEKYCEGILQMMSICLVTRDISI